jgi:hypothetical protein
MTGAATMGAMTGRDFSSAREPMVPHPGEAHRYPQPGSPRMPRVFRVRSTVAYNVAASATIGIVLLLFGLWTSTTGHPAWGGLVALVGVSQGLVAYRCLKLGAYVEDSFLVVRNVFRTRRFAWDSIADFHLRSGSVVWVYLTSGRKLPIWAMSCYPIGWGYVPLVAMMNELRAIAVEHRSPEPSAGSN